MLNMQLLKSQGKMDRVYLGFGSNLGNKLSNIKKAIKFIKKASKIKKISPIYRTEPVGYKKQDWFLNCVVEAETGLHPLKLLSFLKSIEKKLKRKKTVKNGPRTIDIDILFYGDKIVKTEKLEIPHPRMHKRLFVLEPLSKLNCDLIHPKLKKSIKELRKNLKSKNKVTLYRKKL